LRKLFLILMLLPALALAACSEDTSSAARETKATMTATDNISVAVGYPAVINGTEKRLLKMIYELRDDPKLVTYTYITDLNGKLHEVCKGTNSIGYPVPYATQYTAPKAPVVRRSTYPAGFNYQGEWRTFEADQPEPNGLYMPTTAEGTWVVCLNPETKQIAPVYIEDRVRTYPYRVVAAE